MLNRHEHTENSENSVNMDELILNTNLCANISYMEEFYLRLQHNHQLQSNTF